MHIISCYDIDKCYWSASCHCTDRATIVLTVLSLNRPCVLPLCCAASKCIAVLVVLVAVPVQKVVLILS